jgi:hypothetical protein
MDAVSHSGQSLVRKKNTAEYLEGHRAHRISARRSPYDAMMLLSFSGGRGM